MDLSFRGLSETAFSDANRLLQQVSVHAAEVKKHLPAYSIDVAADNQQDVDEEHIVTRLRKVRSVHIVAQKPMYSRLYRSTFFIRLGVPATTAYRSVVSITGLNGAQPHYESRNILSFTVTLAFRRRLMDYWMPLVTYWLLASLLWALILKL